MGASPSPPLRFTLSLIALLALRHQPLRAPRIDPLQCRHAWRLRIVTRARFKCRAAARERLHELRDGRTLARAVGTLRRLDRMYIHPLTTIAVPKHVMNAAKTQRSSVSGTCSATDDPSSAPTLVPTNNAGT